MDTRPIIMTPSEFDAFTRLDFQMFIERVFGELNWTTPYRENFHTHVLAAALEAMRRGETLRLIVNLPPRNLKSIIVSVAFVAWLLGHDPSTKIICVSYGQELAERLARQCRQVMQSAWYQELFPKTRLSPDRQAIHDFETTAGGGRRATSVNGPLTGLGASYILIDDLVTPNDALSDSVRTNANDWYQNTLVSRLDDKLTGRIAIIMQRLHEDDVVGFVQQHESWKVIALAAIAPTNETYVIPTAFGSWTHHRREGEALHPTREPLTILEGIRRVQGPEHFAAQYLQAPVPPGGNMIKIGKFGRFDLSASPAFEQIIMSWDTASKATQLSDFSVCTIWGVANKRLYLIDVVRDRFEFPELRSTALGLARGQYHGHPRPDIVLVEDKASGQSLLQELRREGIRNINPVLPECDKVIRMHAQTAVIANGYVLIPRDAPWLPVFQHELMAFPKGRYDDQVDSMSQALKWFNFPPQQPHVITYMEQEVAKIRGDREGSSEDNRIVKLKGPPNINLIKGREDYWLGPDGYFLLPLRDARSRLPSSGWSLVEEP